MDVGREGKKFTGGHGACQFKLTYYKQRRKKSVDNDDCAVQPKLWKLAKKQTLLQHSPHCPGVLKFKTRQLIAHSGFRNQVRLFYCFLFILTIAIHLMFFSSSTGCVRRESQLSQAYHAATGR